MPFLWFWTFWHWSRESYREGSLLRGPLPGLGSHWDEWFRHEASDEERCAIEAVGRDESSQREFISWLTRHWAREADRSGNRLIPRFALGQLASLPPFNRWTAFSKYQGTCGTAGIHALVLAEESRGERTDVRSIEVVTLPADDRAPASAVVSEGFQADAADLNAPRDAALSLFAGKALWSLLARWIACGRRPYPRWLGFGLAFGWVVMAGLITWLLTGPDPGEQLVFWCAGLLALWAGVVGAALLMAAGQIYFAWREGKRWAAQLEHGEVRLRMNGGLMLKGGSAGLAYCLNMLLSAFRAHPGGTRRSWVWRRIYRKLNVEARTWAATGIVTATGQVKPVVLEAKLRACIQQSDIRHVLTPRQPEAGRGAIERLVEAMPRAGREEPADGLPVKLPGPGSRRNPRDCGSIVAGTLRRE